MKRFAASTVAIVALAMASTTALATPRTAEEIVGDYQAVANPPLDRSKTEDQAYVKQYMSERQAAELKRAALAKELFELDKGHAMLPAQMTARWRVMATGADSATVKDEIAAVIKVGGPEPLVVAARSANTMLAFRRMQAGRGTFDDAKAAVEELVANHPKDPQSPAALAQLASMADDATIRGAVEARLLAEYPDSRAAKFVKGDIRRRDGVGKPFELSFTEAITGQNVSIESLKGKVVVIDFWATWCGPCVAEMPKLKSLYADWKDKGVEFIGVSLDQPEDKGGLTALKAYVTKESLAWPQYYQGNFWDSDFSVSWGVNSIPAVFVVDADGNLHSTDARGKLEEIVPALLARRDAAAKPAN